ncbi:MAG: hypothetical protein EP329_15155 [Deltaproteobacteria bacterium]|nr:MAG: hypothetical protein EP329_15155 [Deltaproteobacteria bacterium]
MSLSPLDAPPAGLPADGEPYGRMPLVVDAAHEMILMRWRPGATCAPHDHGEAAGVIHLVEGVFTERTYAREGDRLVVVATREVAAPAVLEAGPGVIHDMRCDRAGVSLHVYAPRIHGMRVYDLARREVLVVSDDCGAWVPSDPAQVVAREPGPGA